MRSVIVSFENDFFLLLRKVQLITDTDRGDIDKDVLHQKEPCHKLKWQLEVPCLEVSSGACCSHTQVGKALYMDSYEYFDVGDGARVWFTERRGPMSKVEGVARVWDQ